MLPGLPPRAQVRHPAAYTPVPEGYFDQLPDCVLARTTAARVGRRVRWGRWLCGTAAAAALLVGWALREQWSPSPSWQAQRALARVDTEVLSEYLLEEAPFSEAALLDWLADQPEVEGIEWTTIPTLAPHAWPEAYELDTL